MLESGADIRTIQDLMENNDVATTPIYTQEMKKSEWGVHSPLDTPNQDSSYDPSPAGLGFILFN